VSPRHAFFADVSDDPISAGDDDAVTPNESGWGDQVPNISVFQA